MRSTCCALVIVLAPACALAPTPHAAPGTREATPGPARAAGSARPDVPPDWRRPSDGALPWRAWQFVPDDQRQGRRYDHDPYRREYRFGEDRVVPELPGERCPPDDLPWPAWPEEVGGGEE